MEIYPMLTGSQLRQYLHISTRKLKYLMDHDYIPHEATGQATYRYRVRWEDAVEFKRRMEEEPGFLGELAGQFSSHHPPKPRPKREPVFQPTPENCQRFRQWLAQRWANQPDALPIQRAARRSSSLFWPRRRGCLGAGSWWGSFWRRRNKQHRIEGEGQWLKGAAAGFFLLLFLVLFCKV